MKLLDLQARLRDLSPQLEALQQQATALAQATGDAVQELQNTGTPIPAHQLQALFQFAQDFELCRQDFDAAIKQAEGGSQGFAAGAESLSDLREVLAQKLESIDQELKQRGAQKAVEVLQNIEKLTSTTTLPALEQCQAQARALLEAIEQSSNDPQAVEALVSGEHPMCQVLLLVESGEQLENQRWKEAGDAVLEHFGVAMYRAIVAGKLSLTGSPQPQTTTREIRPKQHGSTPLPARRDESPQPRSGKDGGSSPHPRAAVSPKQAVAPTQTRPQAPPKEATDPPKEAKSAEAVATEAVATEAKASPKAAAPQVQEAPKASPKAAATEAKASPKAAAKAPAPKKPSPKPALPAPEAPPKASAVKEPRSRGDLQASEALDAQEQADGAWDIEAMQQQVWQLLQEGRMALALQIGRLVDRHAPAGRPRIPTWVLRALALSPHIRNANGEVARCLREDFLAFDDSCFAPGQTHWNHAIRFLLFAAALRPSVIASSTGASNVLNNLHLGEGLGKLFSYAQELAKICNNFHALDPNALRTIQSQTEWKRELKELCEEARAWSEQAPLMTNVFAPATKIWQLWQKPGEWIYELLLPVHQNDVSRRKQVEQALKEHLDDHKLARKIEHTDRQLLKRKGGRDIQGRSLTQLHKRVAEAQQFARLWLDLHDKQPGKESTFLQTQVDHLRELVERNHSSVVQEVEAFGQQHQGCLPIQASIRYSLEALEHLQELLLGSGLHPPSEKSTAHILYGELLKLGELQMAEDWQPQGDDHSLYQQLCESMGAEKSWSEAFELHSQHRDHEATARILEYLKSTPPPTGAESLDLEALERKRDEALETCREALRRDLSDTKQRIEDAVALGLLREEERLLHSASCETIEKDLVGLERYSPTHTALRSIRDKIAAKREQEVERIRKDLHRGDIPHSAETRKRLNAVLEQGDVLTANEYIDMLRRKEKLPEMTEEQDPFEEFFPGLVESIGASIAEQKLRGLDMVRRLKQRESFAGLDLQRAADSQIESAAAMMETWFSAKARGQMERSQAQELLEHLGFKIASLRMEPGSPTWLELTCLPLRDRSQCPLPFYGSDASGQYRILCVWDQPTEEDLFNVVGETVHARPALVFFFGLMDVKQRRELAQLCRERQRTFLLLDDALMLYLCSVRGSRLPAMFACTLPFTYAKCYQITASLVPPEMFYGRQEERASILDPMGTCFIYGGRQLGKTALLRDVQRTFHKPSEHRIGLWIDLKAAGIGYDRSIDEIWSLLIEVLKRESVLSKKLPGHTSPEKINEHIQHWLEGDASRRILLLLDEADRFLESDGLDEFARTSRLKSLMDQTKRRFKVVFAGLHNVQRTTRQANQPLAHYGRPICIGPLLSRGEWREARALIDKPMGSLGFRFQSPDLITRILSQTNYYPSLLQIYGHELHRHVTNPHLSLFRLDSSPPYEITAKHVEEAYKSQELRDTIRQRFNLTLQLDQRYEVIAYAIAYAIITEEGHQGMVDGFSVSWIRGEAMSWWSEGFENSDSTDAIRSLLEEMVGLGVLRKTDKGNYTLRSPNVVFLLGTEHELMTELVRTRERPLDYETAYFRSALRREGQVDPTQRHPLTAQQESELKRANGVSIIFGSDATRLGELRRFLRASFGDFFFDANDFNDALDLSTFGRTLTRLKGQKKADGTTLLLVPESCAWDAQWLELACLQVQSLKSPRSFVRIVFQAGPQLSWTLEQSAALSDLEARFGELMTVFQLTPWHDYALRQWLQDCGLKSDKPTRDKISRTFGNWPILLDQLSQLCKPGPHAMEKGLQQLEQLLADGQNARHFLASAGLEDGDALVALKMLSDFGARASLDDLAELLEPMPFDRVEQILAWADRLSLVHPRGKDIYQLDPIIHSCLQKLQS